MKINQLRDVIAVANKGSFRAAARYLNMTQSAISRSINELERDLGTVLFDRHARGVLLTPMGERFVQRASLALNELQRARDELQQLQGSYVGKVSVCLSSGALAKLLPGALRSFHKKFPDVTLELIEGQYFIAETGLKEGSIDFYIGPEPQGGVDGDLVVEHFYENTLVILARPGHPMLGAQSLHDLQAARWLSAATAQTDEVSQLFMAHGLPSPHVSMFCKTIHTIILAVQHSDLVALVPKPLAQFGISLGLSTIDIDCSVNSPRSVFIRRLGMPLTPAAEYFSERLRIEN
ncbi:LysR family transcriptional regulator [Pusillimonas sp. T2]|uniref:LysR family transcriptional regulator n=1 Tax=Pusillimonas sp. T2 TaxID=1548123 RepID=UPI000B8A8087|nr:LysR substrate-binding domain-containing protein [Pusillimonas sp. T2]OXR47913.1 LysR family transcriptional regulator [Pusillimonas sp. T2]